MLESNMIFKCFWMLCSQTFNILTGRKPMVGISQGVLPILSEKVQQCIGALHRGSDLETSLLMQIGVWVICHLVLHGSAPTCAFIVPYCIIFLIQLYLEPNNSQGIKRLSWFPSHSSSHIYQMFIPKFYSKIAIMGFYLQ